MDLRISQLQALRKTIDAINALGLRDRQDLQAEKPPGTRRVLFLGDSVTFGLEVDLEETLVKQVESMLDRAECINMGVSG